MNLEEIPVVDVTELSGLSKNEIIDLFDETQRKLIRFCMDLKKDYDRKIRDMQENPDLIPVPDVVYPWKKPGRPELSDNVKKRVRELRAQGLSIRAIADRIGISRGAVHKIVAKP